MLLQIDNSVLSAKINGTQGGQSKSMKPGLKPRGECGFYTRKYGIDMYNNGHGVPQTKEPKQKSLTKVKQDK